MIGIFIYEPFSEFSALNSKMATFITAQHAFIPLIFVLKHLEQKYGVNSIVFTLSNPYQ